MQLAYKVLLLLRQWAVGAFGSSENARGGCAFVRFWLLTVTLLHQVGDTKEIDACSIEKEMIKKNGIARVWKAPVTLEAWTSQEYTDLV